MAITAVTIVGADQSAGVETDYTVGLTPGVNIDGLDRINVEFPAGFDLSGIATGSEFAFPGMTGITFNGAWGLNTFAYQVDVVGQLVAMYLYSYDVGTLLASGSPGELTIADITNPGAGTYPAADFEVSTNDEGPASPASDVVITGSALVPTATNSGISGATADAVQLNGVVSSRGAETTVVFRYGTDPTLGSGTSTVAAAQSPLASDAADAAVSAPLTGLSNQRLYYRIEATNSEGTTNSAILPFSPVATRYWVGGTGNWSSASEWSATSGGAGGAGAPTSTVNARFDANSFSGAGQVVTIDADAEFLSMDWTGATGTPELDFGTDLHVVCYGSLTFIAAMTIDGVLHATHGWTWNSAPPLASGSPTANTINTAGKTIPQNNENPVSTEGMRFLGAGSWTLASAFIQPASHLYFKDTGDFDAAGFDVECRVLSVTGANALDLDGITLTMHDYLLIAQGGVSTVGMHLIADPDTDYVGLDFPVGGQTIGSMYAFKEFGVGDWGFRVSGALTITGRLTLEGGGVYEIFTGVGTISVRSLAVDGDASSKAALTGTLTATRTLNTDFLDLTDCVLAGVTPGYAGANSIDNGGNTNWLFEAGPNQNTRKPSIPSIPTKPTIASH